MAPEQARDPTRAVIESDVYSLGATLFEAITGRPPFRAETLVAALEQIEKHEPPRPRRLNPAVDRDLETICLKCLEKEPAARYRSAGPPCRRPPPLPRPQADHRSPLRPDRLDQEVGPAQPVARGSGLRHGAAAVRRRHGHPDRAAENPCRRGRAEAAQHLRIHHQLRRAPAHRPSRRVERAALAGAQPVRRVPVEPSRQCPLRPPVGTEPDEPGADHRPSGSRADALAIYEEALALWIQLAESDGDNLTIQSALADTWHEIGSFARGWDGWPDPSPPITRRREIRERLVDAEPKNRRFLSALARSHGYIGDWELENGQRHDAEMSYDERSEDPQVASRQRPVRRRRHVPARPELQQLRPPRSRVR